MKIFIYKSYGELYKTTEEELQQRKNTLKEDDLVIYAEKVFKPKKHNETELEEEKVD